MSSLWGTILDTLFPRHCLGCDILLADEAGHYVCRACLREIKFQNTFACAFCASPVIKGITCPYCRRDHSLDCLLVTTSYENIVIKKVIKSMKYRFVRNLAEQIGQLAAKYLNKQAARGIELDGALVVPVPLHQSRLRWRGFNHAEIMAGAISREFGLEVVSDALTRVRNHNPQADMKNRESRIANITSGTFRCANPAPVTGRRIILVDDISTTGSTLDDCASALKGAGAKEVIGLVFARGTPEARKNRKTQKRQSV